MRAITFQAKEVLDNILKDGICYPIKQIRFENAPKTYKRLIDDYNTKKGTSNESLFYVWVKVFRDSDICINKDYIIRCNAMTNIPDNSICLLLEIPDDLVLITSFYNYTDEMYAEEFPEELESIWDSIYDLEHSSYEQQGIIPYITKDMIIDTEIIKIE